MKQAMPVMLVLGAVLAAMPARAQAPAAQPSDNPQRMQKIEAAGASRARLMQVVQELPAAFDLNLNGCTAKQTDIANINAKITVLLDKAIAQESAKPEAERNAMRLQSLNTQKQVVAELWSKYTVKDKPLVDAKIVEVSQLYTTQVTGLMTALNGFDALWYKLNLDPDALKNVYESLEKRCRELKAQVKEALDEVDKQLAAWQTELKNAETWAGAAK
jgi:hypothetical protein